MFRALLKIRIIYEVYIRMTPASVHSLSRLTKM